MSVTSQVTGAGSRSGAAGAREDDDGTAGEGEGTLEVELAHARWRHFAWAMLGCALGMFFLTGFGPAGAFIGVLLLVGGLMAARSFIRTLVYPAGTISLRDQDIVLPPAICAAMRVTVPLGEVRHAYFLRRALPWTTSGPVLILETQRGVFHYPRDWFAADSDQRRLASTLNRRLGHL